MKNNKPFGIIFTVLVSIVFLIAVISWINLYKEPKATAKQIKENEVTAWINLHKIAEAQEKYKAQDWDNDGEFEYSIFLVHLWKTITSKEGETKKLNLITKKLGFATESSTALNGYIFMALHTYTQSDRSLDRIDYTKEWAVYAVPYEKRQTGKLDFIIDHTGRVLVSETQMIYDYDYPFEPTKNGWIEISSLEELKEYQEDVEYLR